MSVSGGGPSSKAKQKEAQPTAALRSGSTVSGGSSTTASDTPAKSRSDSVSSKKSVGSSINNDSSDLGQLRDSSEGGSTTMSNIINNSAIVKSKNSKSLKHFSIFYDGSAVNKYKKSKPHIVKRLLVFPLSTFIFFPIFFILIAGFACHTIWMAFDVRLGAIKTFGTIIHEFDPWFNFRALEYFEKQLRAVYKDQTLTDKKKNVVKSDAERAADQAAGVAIEASGLASKTEELEEADMTSSMIDKSIEEESAKTSAAVSELAKLSKEELLNVKWSQKHSLSNLFDRYFHYDSWKYATFERFFKWFDHESWYPLGRPVGTTIYPGMQLFTSALFRSLKIWNRVAKAQDYNIATWLDQSAREAGSGGDDEDIESSDKGKSKKSASATKVTHLQQLKKLPDMPGQNNTVASDADTISWATKNILYSCRSKNGRMRNCLHRWQKLFKRQILKGNFSILGLSDEFINQMLSIYEYAASTATFAFITLPNMFPGASYLYYVIYDLMFVKFIFNPWLKPTVGSLTDFQRRVKKEYYDLYDTLEKVFHKNWNFLLFKFPDKVLATIKHDWTLTEVACYVPALSGPVASIAVGLLASATVAQPERSDDYIRYTTVGFTFVVGVFFMSIIPAHAQRAVGGGFDNECIAIAPMCFASYFYIKSIQHNVAGDTISTLTKGVGETFVRLIYALLAGLCHAFMAAGWGGYVFLINLIAAHAGAMFILERLRIYRAEPGKRVDQRFSSELWLPYSVFYIVGTSIAIQIPVVGWAPLRSLEQILGLAVFVLFQLARLGDYVMQSEFLMDYVHKFSSMFFANKTRLMNSKIIQFLIGAIFNIRFVSLIVALVGAAMCYGTAMDVDNFFFIKFLERFFVPLTGRVKSLFGYHAARTGNPLIDSVSEHQASNDSIYYRTLDRAMYIAPFGMGFICFDLARLGLRWLLHYILPSMMWNIRQGLVNRRRMSQNMVQKSFSDSSIEGETEEIEDKDESTTATAQEIELTTVTDVLSKDSATVDDNNDNTGPRNRKGKRGRTTSSASNDSTTTSNLPTASDTSSNSTALKNKLASKGKGPSISLSSVSSALTSSTGPFSLRQLFQPFFEGPPIFQSGYSGFCFALVTKFFAIFIVIDNVISGILNTYFAFSENGRKQKLVASKIIGNTAADMIFGGPVGAAALKAAEKKCLDSGIGMESFDEELEATTCSESSDSTKSYKSSSAYVSPLSSFNRLVGSVFSTSLSLLLGESHDFSNPTATAGLYMVIFGWTTYMFSLKMARLIIFMGPTTSTLAAIAMGRVMQWILEPIRLLTFTGDEYVRIDGSTDEEESEEEVVAPIEDGKLESVTEDVAVSSSTKKNKSTSETKSKCSVICATVSVFGFSVKLSIVILRAILFFGIAMRYGIYTHLNEFVNLSWRTILMGMSHPQIVSMNQDGSLMDDYRQAYWWIRDNTPEDARILSWWDYGYQLAGLSKRTTVADGNTWNHEHLAFLGLSLTSPVEEAHMIHRHWADYVLVWTQSDLSKATHMARIANSVYKGHCYDKLCLQFSWTQQGPSDMMKKSFMFAVTNGAQDINNNPLIKSRYKEVFLSRQGAVRIVKVLQVSQKSKRLGGAWSTKRCDAPGSWFCPGDYPPALHGIREIGFHGFGWTITGETADDTKEFQVTTTTTTTPSVAEIEAEKDLDAKEKKLADELKRYRELFQHRVKANLALGPKPNGKLIPKGAYSSSCGGCRLHEPHTKSWYHDLPSTVIKKTRLKCTHCETGGHPRASELEMTQCYDFHEAFKKAGGEKLAYKGWGKDAILNDILVENRRGILYCRQKPHAADVPEGGYQNTCIGCYMTTGRGGSDLSMSSVSGLESGDHIGSNGELKESGISGGKKKLKCDGCVKSNGEWARPVVFKGVEKCMANSGWIQNVDGKLSCTRDRPMRSILTPSGMGNWLHQTAKSLDNIK